MPHCSQFKKTMATVEKENSYYYSTEDLKKKQFYFRLENRKMAIFDFCDWDLHGLAD